MSKCEVREQQYFFEAGNVIWGKEECRKVKFVDDVAGSLAGEYWDINLIQEDYTERKYVFWLQDDSTSGSAPVVAADQTLVQVDYTQGDSAATLATTFIAAITGAVAINAVLDAALNPTDNAEVCYCNRFPSLVTVEDQSGAASLTFTLTEAGIGGYLGRTADGIEVTFSPEFGQALSNQTASTVLDEFQIGQAASCVCNFIELTKERLLAIFAGAVGDSFTPSGGDEVIGGGSSRLFQSLRVLGGKLIIHPTRLPYTDRTRDLVFWLSAPKPQTINYDGTALQQLSCEFGAYLDDSRPAEINLYTINGDWAQDGIEA